MYKGDVVFYKYACVLCGLGVVGVRRGDGDSLLVIRYNCRIVEADMEFYLILFNESECSIACF